MKLYTYSILMVAAASGLAFGQNTAYTIPVGYESLGVVPGFNFDGVRLQNTQIAAGILDAASNAGPNTVTDNEINLGALITGGTTYILELTDGSGIIQEVTSVSGPSLIVAADLTGSVPCSYILRKSATLESVFGSAYTPSPDGVIPGTLDSGLTIGLAGTVGADQIWFWNGVDFTEYYFDEYTEASGYSSPGWVNLDSPSSTVDPEMVNLIYADSFMIVSDSGNDVVLSGEVKKASTELNLVDGFNFVGSVAPAGATLETAFGSAYTPSPDGVIPGTLNSGLTIGLAGTVGADQIWIWNGVDFTEYYFDEYTEASGYSSPGWVNLDSVLDTVDPTLVSLPSGYIITAAGAKNVLQGVPSFYAGF